ncbi:MAG: NAD(+) synthase [Gemmataceae bacterium]
MTTLNEHGFLRLATAAPRLRVADCQGNVDRMLALLPRAESDGVNVLVLPELAITGYTCADLFQQVRLQDAARAGLERLAAEGAALFSGVLIVGVPLVIDDQLFNTACLLHHGEVLGAIPKSFIPNYKEFYERRWFAPAAAAHSTTVELADEIVPFGTHFLFQANNLPGLVIGVEICEDLWVPIPPSSYQALEGATLLVNLSASNETIGKAAYRRQLVVNQSGRCLAAYAYASCGVDESTTDVVFGGHCLIAENGKLLAESPRFERGDVFLSTDVDLDLLRADRLRMNSFGDARLETPPMSFERIGFELQAGQPATRLQRTVEAHPFVPAASAELGERCAEIFHTQVAGLAKRLEHIGKPPVAIGISGGLDSTLALIVACKTMDALGVPRSQINAFTLPGFGTTSRTRGNAHALMQQLGVTAREIDIRGLCLDEMKALGHRPFGIDIANQSVEQLGEALKQVPAERCQDLTFENVQARMRTSLLMNSGFVIGTGDLSELALGWCTYNADHMSMYNPNVSIPKTLVKFLVRWAAEHEFAGEPRKTLLDVAATEISPELLPAGANGEQQSTEQTIGPYELHDFFLFHLLRHGTTPAKLLFLADHARFDRDYADDEIRRWLRVFLERFFQNQYKRSCLPDGPKVGSVSVSPRGDWRMPSDAVAREWLEHEASR